MSLKLTWDDLLIREFTSEQAAKWLGEWDWLVTGRVAPLFLSKFGDWFLRRPDGVEFLNVREGALSTIASSLDEFYAMTNRREWQEEHLLSLMVYDLHLRGKIPGAGECYGIAPHPRLTGMMELEQVMVMPIHAWQRVCATCCR